MTEVNNDVVCFAVDMALRAATSVPSPVDMDAVIADAKKILELFGDKA